MLPSLDSDLAVFLPQPPGVLGLQMCTTTAYVVVVMFETGSFYVAQAGLELVAFLLPQPVEC